MSATWDLSCLDWEDRLRRGQSLLPALPLFTEEAELALGFFDNLRLPDVPNTPTMREACGEWFREIVAATFGSRDPATNIRYIEEIFALVAKKNSKTTYGAGLMLVALLMNIRPRAEFLFIGPTQAIADLAFSQATGMIELDPELQKRFLVREHIKEIKDRVNGAKLKIKTFDLNVLTGPRPAGVLLDELHLLGKNAHAAKVIRQLRGGRQATPEGFLIVTTTQSDEPPAGAFRDELMTARAVRDGRLRGVMLPILYEFPEDVAKDEKGWEDINNWPMVMPNLGRSLRIDALLKDLEAEKTKGEHAVRLWASQHLNVEIGLALHSDRWAGVKYWLKAADPKFLGCTNRMMLDEVIRRCEVATVGIDGGGLDDLLGLCVIGREKGSRRWLVWSHAWVHPDVLEERKEIAPRLRDFINDGSLTLIDTLGDDIQGIVDICVALRDAGVLAQENAIGLDPVGVGSIVDALAEVGLTTEQKHVVGISQGWTLSGAIKTCERKLADGTMRHVGIPMMAWCAGNAKVEPKGNAVTITKQQAGTAKIDPLMAMFDAASLMARNPEASGQSFWMTSPATADAHATANA
jgi:phage terminase large subunit-like protein